MILMRNKTHIYIFGLIVFCSAILTGTSLILGSPYYKLFGGILIIEGRRMLRSVGSKRDRLTIRQLRRKQRVEGKKS